MPRDLRLELVTTETPTPTVISFALDHEVVPDFTRNHKDAAEPPELESVTETWRIVDAVVEAADNAAFWTALNAFITATEVRSGTTAIAFARIVRLTGGGSPATERTLGGAGFQGFRLENFRIEPLDGAEASHLRTIAAVSFDVVAVKVFADGNSVVGWDQVVSNTFENGLQVHERRTTITTAEGTDARTVAVAVAAIDISTFGGSFTFDTNGPDGIDFEYDDADEPNARVPTRVVAVSRIRQRGINVGTTGPGTSINDVRLSVTVADVGLTRRTTTRAFAAGPGALAFVNDQRPGGTSNFESIIITEHKAKIEAEGEWIRVDQLGVSGESGQGQIGKVRRQVEVRITGGAQDEEFVPVTGNLPPVLVVGPLLAVRLTARIVMTLTIAKATVALMPVPKKLGSPWRFRGTESTEDAEPRLVQPGATPGANVWERTAEVVYEAATAPARTTLNPLFADEGIASYVL